MSTELDQAFTRMEQLSHKRGLPGVERSISYDTPALKVAGSTFVRLSEADVLVMQCPADQKALLLEISPQIYFETDHYVGHDAILIRLSVIADEELALRLEDAWRFKAPKHLREQLPTEPPAS